jgi:hypothetical protein
MMCLSDRSTSTGVLSDRSTFTSTDARATDLGHCFFGGVVVVFEVLVTSSVGVLAAAGDVLTKQQQEPECVCKSSSSLPPLSFHGIRAWYRLRAE